MRSWEARQRPGSQEDAGYDEAPVRARVTSLARKYGGPALDMGTGACACMAVAMARRGLRVDAVDHAARAVRIAQERATGRLADSLEVHHADGADLPFPDGFFRVVTAFDALCHASRPASVLTEMFRVCAQDGVVIIVELNSDGRQITRHLDPGFEKILPGLLERYCQGCRHVEFPHHAMFVCSRRCDGRGTTEPERLSPFPKGIRRL